MGLSSFYWVKTKAMLKILVKGYKDEQGKFRISAITTLNRIEVRNCQLICTRIRQKKDDALV